MKRLLVPLLILVVALPLLAQDATSAAALAARQEAADERYKQMASDIASLIDANQALQKKVGQLNEEIGRLREEQARVSSSASSASSGVQEDLKHLADKIIEVDKKREADKEVISEEVKKSISRLETAINAAAAAPVRPAADDKPKKRVDDVPVSDTGYPYVVQPGDTLHLIVGAFNTKFKSQGMKTITSRQVMAANPNVKWDKLRSGQKVIIPKPWGPSRRVA